MADKKPLVVDLTTGKTRQIAAGETVPLANGGTGATTQSSAANAVLPTQSGHGGEFLTTDGSAVSWGAAGGGGTVTTTGSPTSGFLAFFSGATSITSGDLSGDVSTSGTGATTIGALKIATGMVQASAITLAKIQNAAASSKLLGSGASGSGSAYVEITLGTNLSMSGTTLNASGGGGSPGGSSGQIQWNNAGSFDGFTMSGDATLVTSTGVITLATVTVPKGGTGATTLTNHGVLLGQGTSAVTATSAGTATQVLRSGGSGANPDWASLAREGTVTLPTSGAFTWVNQGDASVTDGTAAMALVVPGNASANVRGFVKSTPSTPFSVYMRVQTMGVGSLSQVGILLRNSTNGRLVFYNYYNNSSTAQVPRSSFSRFTSATAFSSTPMDHAWTDFPLWLRADVTSTTITFFASMNGLDWYQEATTETISAFLTAAGGGTLDQYGIAAYPVTSGAVHFVSSFGTTAPA
jgi:hypothetical protein